MPTPTIGTTLNTAWYIVQHDPIVGVCYLSSVVLTVGCVVLLVKTVRLRRSIRATLQARAQNRRPSQPVQE